ncbi:hypothetical protein [Alkalibacterium sp. MB6]|uniref:hypothetical protein n=1 Tax=Alkalibacterium sp. MB6 TaxID=2081965 RepID=UPI00137B4757|nr:hypothetical protein [Alkalibacterium sp. MB6]
MDKWIKTYESTQNKKYISIHINHKKVIFQHGSRLEMRVYQDAFEAMAFATMLGYTYENIIKKRADD